MPKSRSPYPAAFRQQMVELVRSGRTPGDLAREFEPSAEAIRHWVAQADRDAGKHSDGLRTEEQEKIRRLRRENRQLREEREILANSSSVCRVLPIFGSSNIRSESSPPEKGGWQARHRIREPAGRVPPSPSGPASGSARFVEGCASGPVRAGTGSSWRAGPSAGPRRCRRASPLTTGARRRGSTHRRGRAERSSRPPRSPRCQRPTSSRAGCDRTRRPGTPPCRGPGHGRSRQGGDRQAGPWRG